MREAVIDYISNLELGTYRVSKELPFSNAGTELHLKNVKSIYVDKETYSIEEFMPLLNGKNIDSDVTTVRVLFANDSKNTPSNYDQLVAGIMKGKDIIPPKIFFKREVSMDTDHEGDLMVTEIEFRFSKLYKE